MLTTSSNSQLERTIRAAQVHDWPMACEIRVRIAPHHTADCVSTNAKYRRASTVASARCLDCVYARRIFYPLSDQRSAPNNNNNNTHYFESQLVITIRAYVSSFTPRFPFLFSFFCETALIDEHSCWLVYLQVYLPLIDQRNATRRDAAKRFVGRLGTYS